MGNEERLWEASRLRELKARYFRFYDTKQWDAWLALFTADAILKADYQCSLPGDPPGPALELVGRQAIGDHLVPLGPLRRTVHHGHTPEISIEAADRASGIWAMEDIVEYPDRRMHGHGHYHETYRKEDGEWRFASVHLTRLRLVFTDLTAEAAPA